MKVRISVAVAAYVLAIGLPIAADAQVFDMGSLTNTLTIGSGGSDTRKSASSVQTESQPLSIMLGRSILSAPRSSTKASRLVTSFTPSKTNRLRNQANFVARTRTVDAKAADDLQKTFATRDLIGEIGRGIAPFGLRTDDVVDATAVYLATAWYGSQARDDTPSQTQIDGLRAQIRSAFDATPQFHTTTTAERQELTEALLIQALLIGQAATYVKAQPASRTKVASAVAKGARATFGFNLTQMSLSANGLRPR